ncbi:MAG: hypothetical protein Q9218_002353 [Villophora microphyllina]
MDTILYTTSKHDPKKPSPSTKSKKEYSPQQTIDRFWKTFATKKTGKPFKILPTDSLSKRKSSPTSTADATSQNAETSYEEAAAVCRAEVEKHARDCRRLNQRYKDPDFDIEYNLMQWLWAEEDFIEDCLVPLGKESSDLRPRSVKRVEDIFENPQFHFNTLEANEVRQGRVGDCWFMAAICALGNREDLLHKICVARDEKVGVYGFVFYRDGEWIHEVIDDKLYLVQEDLRMSTSQKSNWEHIEHPDRDEKYRQAMQTGSDALYFAKCRNPNATWLPLLQKAYAKAHGDYGSIIEGWTGQGIEDLTGGVTFEIIITDILDKDKFWTDELMNVNKIYLFGLYQMLGAERQEKGIVKQHAYMILEARELDDFRLLKMKNPWGKKGWKGPWSDGSEEWTPDRMSRLDYTFGNDGVGDSVEYHLPRESQPSYFLHRSVSTELDLDAGQYTVSVKITASRYKSRKKPEEVIMDNCERRPEKLKAVGRKYDLAHARGRVQSSGLERAERLRRSRHDKKKLKARKEFEKRRLADKKEKLIRLRREAQGKPEPKDAAEDPENISISMTGNGSVVEQAQQPVADKTAGGIRSMSHEGSGLHIKVSVEKNEHHADTERTKEGRDKEVPHASRQHDESRKEEEGVDRDTPQLLNPTLDDISDDNLSWASDVNAPAYSDTSDSSDSDTETKPITVKPSPPSKKEDGNGSSEEKSASKDVKDPWNAVCTFGLRVYTKGPQAEIEVVKEGDE